MAIDPEMLDNWKLLVERHREAEYSSHLEEMMVLDEFAQAVVDLTDELQLVRSEHAALLAALASTRASVEELIRERDEARRAAAAARADADRTRGALRQLEYSRSPSRQEDVVAACPACGGSPARGHDAGCRLAAALR